MKFYKFFLYVNGVHCDSVVVSCEGDEKKAIEKLRKSEYWLGCDQYALMGVEDIVPLWKNII